MGIFLLHEVDSCFDHHHADVHGFDAFCLRYPGDLVSSRGASISCLFLIHRARVRLLVGLWTVGHSTWKGCMMYHVRSTGSVIERGQVVVSMGLRRSLQYIAPNGFKTLAQRILNCVRVRSRAIVRSVLC